MPTEPLWRRYLRFFGPDRAADLDDEMAFHVQMMADDYQRRGLSEDEARRRALQEFGDARRARRECESIDRPTFRRRVLGTVDALLRDLHYGVRSLIRSPGFAIVAITTLALGMGAAVAIFSVVNAVLLRPLPYPEPDRLVRLWEWAPTGETRNPVSPANVVDWAERARSFSAIGPHQWAWSVTLTGDGEATRIQTSALAPAALAALGIRPVLGRLFLEDDRLGDGRVVLLSHDFWRDRFGSEPAVIGRRLVLDDVSHEVIGVLPPGFGFPGPGIEAWLPVTTGEVDPVNRRSHNWAVIARLAPGVTLARARAEMETIAATLAVEHPAFMKGWRVWVVPLHADLVEDVRPLLNVLLGGVLLVFVIACVNVANLLVARGMTRARELAVRGALGAGRGRLAAQLLIEGGLLAAIATGLGLGVAAGLLRALLRLAPADIPRLDQVSLDGRVLGFALGAGAVATVLLGLLPAARQSRTDLQTTLRGAADRGGGRRHARVRAALLIGEVALSLVLLVGAGLLLRSGIRLGRVDYGYRPEGLLAVSYTLPRARYPDGPQQVAGFERVLEQVRVLPGVTAVTSTSTAPAAEGPTTFSFAIQGREAPNPSGRFDAVPLAAVAEDYFQTLEQPLQRGRPFDRRDRADGPPVAIVNEALVRRLWPHLDPVGQRIAFREGQPWIEIVGVVGDTRTLSAVEPPTPMLYIPLAQKPWTWLTWQTLLVRAAGDRPADELSRAVTSAIRQVDPLLAPSVVAAVPQLYADSLGQRRFATMLVGAFAVAALVLGVVGLFGVLSGLVAERRREIAIRSALGAGRRRVIGLVVGQALGLTLAGVALGGAAAVALTGLLSDLLFEISPLDPVTFGAVATLLVVVALAAAAVPARRAAGVEPLAAMRDS